MVFLSTDMDKILDEKLLEFYFLDTSSSLQANNIIFFRLRKNMQYKVQIFKYWLYTSGSAIQQERQDDLANTLLSLRQVLKLHMYLWKYSINIVLLFCNYNYKYNWIKIRLSLKFHEKPT